MGRYGTRRPLGLHPPLPVPVRVAAIIIQAALHAFGDPARVGRHMTGSDTVRRLASSRGKRLLRALLPSVVVVHACLHSLPVVDDGHSGGQTNRGLLTGSSGSGLGWSHWYPRGGTMLPVGGLYVEAETLLALAKASPRLVVGKACS